MISASDFFVLKALIFELEDRARCGALSVMDTLLALDAVQLNYMLVQRKKLAADISKFAALRKLSEIKVPKLTAENYAVFTTVFCSVILRTIGMNGITIDYVMHGVTRNYDYPWMNREDKLKNFLLHTVDYLNNYNIPLY